ncbi:nucleoside hydrolase-like domain-containing protein [Cyclobacterium salsum]|uniref:nucleoside hydrolase-like domain-containing protein n=1 Tax=Cyclobacterium salsum TaxID=2666329 RepID=UPI0013910479|nr:nucleoside hydrolase-like domain-containing protein [Cyclobacterium salsum]
MTFRYFNLCLTLLLLIQGSPAFGQMEKPRVLVSTDVGGTDPDDFQSLIHLFMYADKVAIEGLIASPFGEGRTAAIHQIIDLYEQDYPLLSGQAEGFPEPESLRTLTKQGAISSAPFAGYANASEGSDWIIHCARKQIDRPLWVLVWGGLEDLAQALHDAPDIEEKIRVYWIGGPNKKWSVNSYAYIAQNHPELWMVEANASYRGWFMDNESPDHLKGDAYYSRYIQGKGAMGEAFKDFYGGRIKMGDTPSLAYLLHGDPDDPEGESWGGSFVPIDRSARVIFDGNSSPADTVNSYATLEWRFKGPEMGISPDSACFHMEIWDQVWPGYYLGDGVYSIRYSPKRAETGSYETISELPALHGLKGGYTSTNPWPGRSSEEDFQLGSHWYSDRPDPDLFIEDQQGARTIAQYREEYLLDWAKRWDWLSD